MRESRNDMQNRALDDDFTTQHDEHLLWLLRKEGLHGLRCMATGAWLRFSFSIGLGSGSVQCNWTRIIQVIQTRTGSAHSST